MTDHDLEEFNAAFRDAEAAIKLVENRMSVGLIQPAVNELRYATNHLMRARFPAAGEDAGANASKAIGHCKRARYDAAEGGIKLCLRSVKRFQDDYARVVITTVLPQYQDLKKQIREARDAIHVATNGIEKEAQAAQCMMHFETLAPLVEQLEDARPELNKLEIARRTASWRWALGILIALGSLGVAAYAVRLGT